MTKGFCGLKPEVGSVIGLPLIIPKASARFSDGAVCVGFAPLEVGVAKVSMVLFGPCIPGRIYSLLTLVRKTFENP